MPCSPLPRPWPSFCPWLPLPKTLSALFGLRPVACGLADHDHLDRHAEHFHSAVPLLGRQRLGQLKPKATSSGDCNRLAQVPCLKMGRQVDNQVAAPASTISSRVNTLSHSLVQGTPFTLIRISEVGGAAGENTAHGERFVASRFCSSEFPPEGREQRADVPRRAGSHWERCSQIRG